MTPKQQRFVAEYIIDLNATQAAIRAGYKANNANVTGPRLLANVSVAEAIAFAQGKTAERLEITAEKVLADLEDARRQAMATLDWSPAIRACELLGKHIGMFVDRSETTVTERMVVAAPPPEENTEEWLRKYGPKH